MLQSKIQDIILYINRAWNKKHIMADGILHTAKNSVQKYADKIYNYVSML